MYAISAFKRKKLEKRPLISFMLLVYNQERFITEAVHSALSQTYSPLEIIISDDCSSDKSFEIVNSLVSSYSGEHCVFVRKNETNLGLLAHINKVMEMVTSDLIVVAAGDDISLPHRVEHIAEIWKKEQASVICSNAMIIDQDGGFFGHFFNLGAPRTTFNDILTGKFAVIGASCAWDKKVFDVFGPLSGGAFNEDLMIPFRAALINKVRYTNDVLLYYRKHDANLSTWMKAPLSSARELTDLILENQKNILMNCYEFKRLLEIGKNKGLVNINYKQADEILDERIKELTLELELLVPEFWLRFGTLLKNIGMIHGINKIIKFLLIVASPALFAVIVRRWSYMKKRLWLLQSFLNDIIKTA